MQEYFLSSPKRKKGSIINQQYGYAKFFIYCTVLNQISLLRSDICTSICYMIKKISYFYSLSSTYSLLLDVTGLLIIFINPKPHGRGRICPHPFQRPITQKVLSAKNRQKIPIPRKSSAESKSRVM
jgi:hypothetical protein